MLLNEIDAAFTKEGIDMRIAFALYVDTYFAPIKERLKNEKRFVMMYAPIKRSYSNSINENSVIPEQSIPYVRNAWRSPSSTEEVAAFLRDWKKICKTPGYVFEYHWWLHQYYDPGHMTMARRIYEDVLSLKYLGLQGSVEDGTKRGFFPNGFSFYIYAETLMDRDCNYEEIREDYFKHIYGEDFAVVLRYLEKVSAAFDLSFMEGELSKNERISFYYDPDRVPELQNVHEYTAEIRRQISLHMTMPTRPQTVSWRLLLDHAEYCDMLADCMIEKVQGRNALALEKYQRMVVEFGKRELAIERYYDHMMAMNAYSQIFNMVKERKKYQIVF